MQGRETSQVRTHEGNNTHKMQLTQTQPRRTCDTGRGGEDSRKRAENRADVNAYRSAGLPARQNGDLVQQLRVVCEESDQRVAGLVKGGHAQDFLPLLLGAPGGTCGKHTHTKKKEDATCTGTNTKEREYEIRQGT